MGIIVWLLIGLVAGAIARLLVPGRDAMGCVGTLGLGLAGSLVGGFLGNVLFGDEFRVTAAGLIGSVVGAILILILLRLTVRRGERG